MGLNPAGVTEMSKTKNPMMHLLVMLAGALLLTLVVSFPMALLPFVGVDITSRGMTLLLQAIVQPITFLIPVLYVLYRYYRDERREFCRADLSLGRWCQAGVGIVIVVLLAPFTDWITEWNNAWDLGLFGEVMRRVQDQTEGTLDTVMKTDSLGGMMVNMLVIALIPAVCEELFFRVGMQNLLERWMTGNYEGGKCRRYPSIWQHVAVWVTAMVFSLFHGEIFSFMPRFVMGLLLGYLYIYGNSIVVNVVAHFFNNALVVLMYWLSQRGVLSIDPEATMGFPALVTVSCTAASLILFYVTFNKRKKEVEGCNPDC